MPFWLLCVMRSCVFVTFPYGVLGRVWYLIVSIPDICLLPYLVSLKGGMSSVLEEEINNTIQNVANFEIVIKFISTTAKIKSACIILSLYSSLW